MKTHTRHLLTLAVLLGFTAPIGAQTSAVPDQISYQGFVTDTGGNPIGNSTPENRTIVFRIWDHPTNTAAPNLIYSEQQVVTISKGEFSVLVGDGIAVTGEDNKGKPTVTIPMAFAGTTRFIGISVYESNGGVAPEISPRQRIVSSAYAYRARFAETLGSNGGTAISTLNDGRVGVGNTNPPSLFTITGANTSTSTSTPQMVITADDVTERLRLGVDSTGNGTGFIQSFKEGTGAQNLLLNPSGGNVGIGNTAPTARLDVTGGIKAAGASGFTFNTGDLDGGLFSPADGVVTLRTNNTERLRVDGSGNVGIGTTTPGERLTIVGSGSTNTSTALSVWNSATTSLLHVRNDGNVGIGTNAPAARLDVAGKASAFAVQARSSVTSRDQGGYLEWNLNLQGETNINNQKGSGVGGFTFNEVDANNSYTERMRISGSGNVGIGTTTPGAPLSVRATSNTSPSTNGLFVSNPTNSANNHAILGLSTQGAAGNPMLAFDIVGNAGYTIGIDNADDRLKISRDWGAFTNTMMTFTGSGDVGIGTTTPAHKLDVIGGTQSQWLELRANSGTPYIDFSSNTTTDYHARIIWQGTTTNRLDFEAPRFVFTGGRIGVGTTGPTCPLDVRGGTDVVLNGNYTSIRSEWFVQAFGYGTMSDQRIKQIVDRSSPVSDLDTVMKLKVTNYQMKAQVMKGNPVHKGLIAQEVEKVIPEAVLKSEAYVPEIFELAKVAEYNSESKSLKVTMGKPHGLAVGDMVMITSKDAETDQSHYLKVTQVTDEKAFVVGDVAAGIKKAFVFGKQVKDFRSVDYNRIYTTGIGAIQQIKREKDAEVKALKEENTELKARVIALEAQTQRLADLEAKDKAREAKLAAIEKLLLAAEKGTVKPVSLKKSAGGAE
jgi:hypothetical protein